MAKIVVDSREIAYSVSVEGKPLVLLNGIFMTSASWQSFVPAFSKNNCLILIDFVDHGYSARESEQYTHELQIEVVRAVLKELKIEKALVIGFANIEECIVIT